MNSTKKLLGVLTLVGLLLTTGCIDILEEITLKKDGTGVFKLTMDISQVLSGPMMEGLRSELPKDGSGTTEKLEMDSSMVFFDVLPAETKASMDDADFWKNVSLDMNISESKEVGLISFVVNFEEIGDIDKFYKGMVKLQEDNNSDANKQLGGIMKMFGGSFTKDFKQLYKLKKRKITRFKQPKEAAGEGAEADENMAMMKMMMTDAKYKSIYHLPGKVKKASHPDAKIDGKDVMIEVNLLDYMEGKITLENEIKFKKR